MHPLSVCACLSVCVCMHLCLSLSLLIPHLFYPIESLLIRSYLLTGPYGMEEQIKQKLDSNGIGKGDDLIVMVVNEGEIDLFLNFACSCRAAKISMSKVLVFAASR